jgi:predicted transposase YdaD
MRLFLERTDTIKSVEKEKIKERLNMFDQLFEESPWIQELREKYRVQFLEQGLREGLQKGRLEALQDLLVSSIQTRYPDLAELAQQQAGHFDKLDTLKLLIQQVMTAPNADTARRLLESGPA